MTPTRPRVVEDFAGPEGTVRMRHDEIRQAQENARREMKARAIRESEVHVGDLIADRYRVEQITDRQNGLLIDARHELFGQPVALRLMPAHQVNAKTAERMRRQARAVAELDSEHVARILDAGTLPGGGMYIAREHIDGDLLIHRARAAGGLEIEEVISVFIQICEAVQEAHARGIVLRDLRPEHLSITTKKSGEPIAKIIEMGACMVNRDTFAENSCTRNDLSPWASPELVRQEETIDTAADIWTLGCLLYELLCGARPFKGTGPQLMLAITQDEAPAPSSKRRGVPRVLDNIVRWALDKDRTRRPRTVHALVHALWPMANTPGQLLIDRIARLSMGLRKSAPRRKPMLTFTDQDPTNVMSREEVDAFHEAYEAEPPSLVTPIIPAPVPVPSMTLLDRNDPLKRSAVRRGMHPNETAFTPL